MSQNTPTANADGDDSTDGEVERVEHRDLPPAVRENIQSAPVNDPNQTSLNDGADLEIAVPADFGIRRGEDGELLPVKQRIPGTDMAILTKPVTGGARDEFADVFDAADAPAERIAELWRRHIVEPEEWAEADAEYIEEGLPYGYIAGINQALKHSSGEDVFRAVQDEQVESVLQDLQLMEQLSPEQMEALNSMGASNDSPP